MYPDEYYPRDRAQEAAVARQRAMVGAGLALGLGALAGVAAWQMYGEPQRAARPQLRGPAARIADGDDAPERTARDADTAGYVVGGRTVTIAADRHDVYTAFYDYDRRPLFMGAIAAIEHGEGDTETWVLKAPLGGTMSKGDRLPMRRVQVVGNERLVWQATEDAPVEAELAVTLSDAPGGRGTRVEAVMTSKPRLGSRVIAALTRSDPAAETRHDLKRLKMLLETGEIATNAFTREQV